MGMEKDLASLHKQQHIINAKKQAVEHKFQLENITKQDCLLLQVPNINESGYYSGVVALKSYIDKFHDDIKVAIIDPIIDYFFENPPDRQSEFFNLFNTYTKQGEYWLLYDFPELGDMVTQYLWPYIDKANPTFLGFSIIDGNIDATIAIAKLTKEKYPHLKILFGGNGIEVLDFGLLPNTKYETRYYDFIDVFVRGDGELTFVELMSSDWTPESLSSINGIVWWNDGTLIHNGKRDNVDMEVLPFPDYSPLEENYYYKSTYQDNVPLVFSRGCPYRCSFCSVPDFIPVFRYRKLETVLEEIQYWMDKGRRSFFCHDSIINGNPKWLKEFCEAVIEKGWPQEGFIFGGNMRLGKTMRDKDTIRLYKNAGLIRIITGFESASEPVLQHMKKYTNMEGVREIFQNVREVNEDGGFPLKFSMQIIIGYLNETREDFLKTYEFIKEYHDVMSEILTCSAFLLHEPLRKRWINEGNEFYNFENNVVYDTDYNTTIERLTWLDEIEKMFKQIGINHSVYNRGVLKEHLDNSNVVKTKPKKIVANLI